MSIIFGGVHDYPRAAPGGSGAPPRRKPETGTKTFVFEPDPDPEETKRWYQAQISWPNLASDAGIAERAIQYVKLRKRWYQNITGELRDQWRTKDWLLKGNSLSKRFPESDVHVPALYQAVESAVPSLIEAMFAYDPWFHVGGRDRMDRQQATRIRDWLVYLLDEADFDLKAEAFLRTMVIYGFAAFKVWWDARYRSQIVREAESHEKNGLPGVKLRIREDDVLVHEGLCIELVDPYKIYLDARHTDQQRSSFIGDTSDWFLEDVLRYGDLDDWANLDKVAEQQEPHPHVAIERFQEMTRSLTTGAEIFARTKAPGQAKEVVIDNVWCRWSPHDDLPTEEYQIVVVNEQFCTLVRRNPYDDQHRPYAISRASREPFGFHNIGPLDHAVRLNIELDDHRNLSLKSHALSQCPVVFAEDMGDLPSNIFDVEPGTVFHTPRPPTFHRAESTVGEMIAMDDKLRRDIDETVGIIRVPTDLQGDTATQTERIIQERNRRMRSMVYAASDGFDQILRQAYSLSGQYVTDRQKFRVLGRAGANAGDHLGEVGPQDFGSKVDFVFEGIRGLQSLGLRATQISNFMVQAGPLMQSAAGLVNVPKLIKEIYEGTVGRKMDDDMLDEPPSEKDLMSQEQENMLIALGQDPGIHELDDDRRHIRVLEEFERRHGKNLSQKARELVAKHRAEHANAAQQKQMREQARGTGLPSYGGPRVQGEMEPEGRPEPGKGRNGRTPDLMGDVATQSMPGVTPGPPMAQAMPSPDRQNSVPQTDNGPRR